MVHRESYGLAYAIRMVQLGVVVAEQKQVAPRGPGAQIARGAGPPILIVTQHQIAAWRRQRSVGCVIDHYDLEVRIALSTDRFQQPAQAVRSIAGRNDDAHQWQGGIGQVLYGIPSFEADSSYAQIMPAGIPYGESS